MDDNDDKKFERRRGPKPTGRREQGTGSAGHGKKPFVKRGAANASGEKPKRDFSRDAKFRGEAGKEGSKPPFRKKFQRDGAPFEKRGAGAPRPGRSERSADDRPRSRDFDKRSDRNPEQQRRPFAKPAERNFHRDAPERQYERQSDRLKRAPTARKGEGGFRPRPAVAESEAGERIARRLARVGIASRRDAEELIAAGRVKVNGRVLASPAFNVMAGDVIQLDGTEIPPVERTRVFLFHKPAGVVTTNRDPQGRKTVFDVLPADLPRLMTIGRLDINTEGLLLLTNDGGLSRVLELPATGWLRRYRARVHGKVEESALASLREGIAVDGVFYGAVEANLDREQGTNAWLTLGLREGKNREVKNILGALGLEVTRLIRISYGPFQLGDLPEGHVLEIKGRMLRDQLGERLIEEAGANFEAEISHPFSNKPVRRQETRSEAPPARRKPDRPAIGEGGLIKRRKWREDSREEALGKLSTRPEGARGRDFDKKTRRGGKPADRERAAPEPPSQRRANVWMAPGARPRSKDHQEAEDGNNRPARDREPGRKAGSKPFGKPHDDRPGRSGKDGFGRSGPRSPRKGPKDR
jgi:23S rRNA pseudouridine2605 synthase